MIRYQTEKFTLNMLEVYTSNYAGCGINVDDGYIYVEWKDKFNPYSEPKRKYFVQYYNTILCVPQDEFEAHYRNIQYFVDDLGRALDPVVTGDRPTENERNIMIENIKKTSIIILKHTIMIDKIEHKIGEVIDWVVADPLGINPSKILKVTCRKIGLYEDCSSCVFKHVPDMCCKFKCSSGVREDGNDVIYTFVNGRVLVDRELLSTICKYCEDQAIYDKLSSYDDFYYKIKKIINQI